MEEREELLLHVIEGINRTLELKHVLKKCMEATKVVMQSEASSLMLLDEITGDLNISIPTGPVKDEVKGMTIPKNKGIGGWVISYNQPFISNDVVESDIFWKDLSTGFTTRNIICVPLRNSKGEAFGVMQAINKKEGKPFVNEDVPVFEAFAIHVATAIERSKKYDELENKLHDRNTQLSEIHHRLKNNLAIISALIEFDLEEVQDERSKEVLSATSSRIRSVADAHALLYDKPDQSKMDLSEYLLSIAHNVENIFSSPDKDIILSTRFEPVMLNSSRSMVCGLILNELLINAYKHAFVKKDSGDIIISLKRTGKDKIVMIVTDDGIGFKDDSLKYRSGKPNGQFIINALVEKLDGDITYTQNPEIGSTCLISFPA
ncbi:histidine kinase dimerization/phosphoacceptor domain -containing protein [Gracilimonas tropica]|uniref:histidine kinase dimerization/phosphoacceptor domain -containing protein n=1 Tax=Gracilimonas tropica TaxID=454600 RepID=UPI000369A130|nr:histidine kinase dimerization/phosphoacceptor domain -containing protein [Gracilimonas tropica]